MSTEDVFKQSRHWFITENNPQQHNESLSHLKPDGTDSEETLQRAAESYCNIWLNEGKGRDLTKNGAGAVFELSESGTLHVHMVIVSNSAIRLETIRNRYPYAHIEPAKIPSNCIAYLDKTGSGNPKSSTQLCDPVFLGTLRPEVFDSKPKTTMEEIDNLLEEGYTPDAINAMGMRYSRHGNATERCYRAMQKQRSNARKDVEVILHVGAPSSGKSSAYDDLVDDGNDVYYVATYEHPFDDYQGERVIFLDNLGADSLPHDLLLSILEPRCKSLPARYGNKPAVYDELHLVYNLPPEEILDGSTLGRLLHKVYQLLVHIRYMDVNGEVHYEALPIDPLLYENLETAEELAMDTFASLAYSE